MSKARKGIRSPLGGIRILVGRARHQAGALSAELRGLGAEVVEIPFIEIRKPHSFRALDSALQNLANYDWLILTSVNGVDVMWNRVQAMGLDDSGAIFNSIGKKSEPTRTSPRTGRQVRIAAIGPATKAALEKRGFKVDLVPREYVAESVVSGLKARVRGNRVLLVRAKVARDVIPRELRRAGAKVDVVEAYETVVPRGSRIKLNALLRNPRKRPNVVTFTSSSTVKNFVQLIGSQTSRREDLGGILMASIGPVTSATLREMGLPVHISAHKFTIAGLVRAIVRRFSVKNR